MSKRTREKKDAKSQQLAKPDAISFGRRFAQPYAKARLLIDHPHSYREWNIVGHGDVPGFFLFGIPIPLKPWRAAGGLHDLGALSSRVPI
jgi:hypothetical protein